MHYQPFRLPLFFWEDLFLKFLLLLCTAVFGMVGLMTIADLFKGKDQETTLLFVSIVFIAIGIFISSSNAVLYKELVEKRGFLNPWMFLLWYVVLLIFCIVTLPTFIIPILVAFILSITARQTKEWLELRYPLWHGSAAAAFKPYGVVKRYYNKQLSARKEEGIAWGGLRLLFELAVHNFLLLGSIGSGKTLNIKLFVQSIIPKIGRSPHWKAIVYDYKRDQLQTLLGINPHVPIYILNAFDDRSSAWALEQDIDSPAAARQAAALLAPEGTNTHTDSFWRNATLLMLEGLFTYFTLTVPPGQPPHWRLRDVLVATRSTERLKAVLGNHPQTKDYLLPLEGEKLTHSIMVTIQTYLGRLATIAALWEDAESRISIKEWKDTSSVLLLGFHPEYAEALTSLNQLLLSRLFLALLEREDQNHVDTFFIADEFYSLGKIPGIEVFLTTARSKGCSILAALQAYTQLVQVYGKDAAEILVGQFYHRANLRVNDNETAWTISNHYGTGERFAVEQKGNQRILCDYLETCRIVPPEDLKRIPPPSLKEKTGLRGFYTAGKFSYWYTMSSKALSQQLIPPNRKVRNFQADKLKRGERSLYLKTWDEADLRRLGLTHLISIDDYHLHLAEEQTIMGSVPPLPSPKDDSDAIDPLF